MQKTNTNFIHKFIVEGEILSSKLLYKLICYSIEKYRKSEIRIFGGVIVSIAFFHFCAM